MSRIIRAKIATSRMELTIELQDFDKISNRRAFARSISIMITPFTIEKKNLLEDQDLYTFA